MMMTRFCMPKSRLVVNLFLLAFLCYAPYWLYLELNKQICMDLCLGRANRLLRIIQDKEAQFRDELRALKVPELYNIIDTQGEFFRVYRRQIDLFGQIEDKYFAFNQEMMDKLLERSKFLSFEQPVYKFPLIEPLQVCHDESGRCGHLEVKLMFMKNFSDIERKSL